MAERECPCAFWVCFPRRSRVLGHPACSMQAPFLTLTCLPTKQQQGSVQPPPRPGAWMCGTITAPAAPRLAHSNNHSTPLPAAAGRSPGP